jgi:hypothetical protein
MIRGRKCRKTFSDRYGTAFYDLKTPEEKVQRAIQQGLEGFVWRLSPASLANLREVAE